MPGAGHGGAPKRGVSRRFCTFRAAAEAEGLDADLCEGLWRQLIEWSIAREARVLGDAREARGSGDAREARAQIPEQLRQGLFSAQLRIAGEQRPRQPQPQVHRDRFAVQVDG